MAVVREGGEMIDSGTISAVASGKKDSSGNDAISDENSTISDVTSATSLLVGGSLILGWEVNVG